MYFYTELRRHVELLGKLVTYSRKGMGVSVIVDLTSRSSVLAFCWCSLFAILPLLHSRTSRGGICGTRRGKDNLRDVLCRVQFYMKDEEQNINELTYIGKDC